MLPATADAVTDAAPARTAAPLDRGAYLELRRRAIFECSKWDPQAEDVEVLAPFPIVLSRGTWGHLAATSERLAAETLVAEEEIRNRPDLHRRLGLPRPIRRALRAVAGADPVIGPRFMRFDFHPTPGGWLITEVNSDVPGGFIEASGVSSLVAEHYPGLAPAGDPAQTIIDALAPLASGGAAIALVHATAFTDDRQVMAYLARRFADRATPAVLCAPDQLCHRAGRLTVLHDADLRIGAIMRFYPAEWLPNLPRRSGWRWYFGAPGPRTPQSNPATALLTQSKRFPLVWDSLRTPLPTWRAVLPETRDPRAVDLRAGDWVLKPTLGRVGDGIAIRDVTDAPDLRRITRAARIFPGRWAAQRRFVPTALDGDAGYPCIGVYVIDGKAAGAYGRIAARPLIDARARDAAVLVQQRTTTGGPSPTPTIPRKAHEPAGAL